jgi:hypothetical protein
MHAFFTYADCYHEVEEVTSGARLALVYSLNQLAGDAAATAKPSPEAGGMLDKRVTVAAGAFIRPLFGSM